MLVDVVGLERKLATAQAELVRKRDQIRTLTLLVDVFRLMWDFYYDRTRDLEAEIAPLLDAKRRREDFPYLHPS